MADNVALPAATGNAAADEVTYSGDTAKVQLVRVVQVSGAEGSRTVVGPLDTLTVKHANITTAVTDTAIITASSGTRIVVTSLTATLDNASTVFPTVLIGFGATTTPTTTGVIAAHGGVPAGGGFSRGDGSGVIGVGAAGDDLRITTTGNATGNGLQVCVGYYLVST